MAYVHRRVVAGSTVEHKKMHSSRANTKGIKRQPGTGTTSEKQAKVNERVSEEELRWNINANFRWRDLHVVLHYYTKGLTFDQLEADAKLFLKHLRRICAKRGIKYKRVVVLETKSMTNPHIHVVISRMDPEIIAEAWESIPEGGGAISYTILDKRGNHFKLAQYLTKESRSTMARYKEMGRRGKRFWCSQHMDKPVVTYKPVAASSWRKDPKAKKGATLFKFDDGATCRSGWHEISGYPYQEYFEVFNE